ncbi:hypothetical protein ARMSODRAFT_1014299 [Armillaria solidipes]|uniref:F-box domain-containing protein n=1 Tax=Armillaria solidipes TaxID=1076256 RepID=A0A2H3CCV5_9AGAR|nr:hypothetical protein ARMSODRAFT_1014299 [Armillaria solidipes]
MSNENPVHPATSTHRLPPELLEDICLQTFRLQNVKGRVAYDVAHIAESPWVLGHICRSWGHISTLLPTLWSTLLIQETSSTDPKHFMAKLDVALCCSRNVPLTFSASFGSRDVNFMRIAMARLVARWQHAAFTLHADLQQTMLPALFDLSSLESFSLNVTRVLQRGKETEIPAGILDTAPKLRTICLYPLTTIHLPQQLAELNVGPITVQKLLHLLSAAPELKVFRARLSTSGARVLTSLTYTSLQVLLLRLDFLSLSPFKYLTIPSPIHLTCDETINERT